ncbi:flavin reductase [Aeromicrobium phragmitis]|uniref:Flavin reductase n=1 Tax=Aeromicrobium phragmitis TaxID=2478914 RepID=A0A3L8PKZ4_9ACTN|nr:flavin reductase [Aeromicrobium phragmitis]RLV55258.1 flavin reductase [Aeromicrobium phragmitis]
MTIHSDHPFVPPESDRDVVRRFRGRLAASVTVVATGEGRDRSGLTVSSLVIVDGPKSRVVAFVDPDSELGEAVDVGTCVTVSLLTDGDQFLADAFAGLAPAPGGAFRLGDWNDTAWGPVHAQRSWLGARIEGVRELGYALEIVAVVEHAEIHGEEGLVHVRGRYRSS